MAARVWPDILPCVSKDASIPQGKRGESLPRIGGAWHAGKPESVSPDCGSGIASWRINHAPQSPAVPEAAKPMAPSMVKEGGIYGKRRGHPRRPRSIPTHRTQQRDSKSSTFWVGMAVTNGRTADRQAGRNWIHAAGGSSPRASNHFLAERQLQRRRVPPLKERR